MRIYVVLYKPKYTEPEILGVFRYLHTAQKFIDEQPKGKNWMYVLHSSNLK